MAEDDPIQTVAYAEEMSVTAHSALSAADEKAFAETVLAEELNLGADRARNKISFVDEITMYEMAAADSMRYKTSVASLRTLVESYVQVRRPQDLLIIAPEFIPLASTYPAENVWIGNSIHVDYAERHGMLSGDFSYRIVPMQQIDDGEFPTTFEMAIVNVSHIQQNLGIVDNLINSMISGGTVIVTNFSNSGNLYRYQSAHQYHEGYRRWQQLPDVNIYPIPLLFGVSVITKR